VTGGVVLARAEHAQAAIAVDVIGSIFAASVDVSVPDATYALVSASLNNRTTILPLRIEQPTPKQTAAQTDQQILLEG